MRRYGFTLLQAIGVLALVLVLAAILLPIFVRRPSPNFVRNSCFNHLKQIALGMKQYIGDNNEKYPPISVHSTNIGPDRPFGWADALQPYIKSIQVLQCPSEPTPPVGNKPTASGYTDFWYNANCARQDERNFTFVSNTVMLGDGAIGGGDARYNVTSEPNNTTATARHLEGNDYAFADGHVKWLKPGKVVTAAVNGTNASFAIK